MKTPKGKSSTGSLEKLNKNSVRPVDAELLAEPNSGAMPKGSRALGPGKSPGLGPDNHDNSSIYPNGKSRSNHPNQGSVPMTEEL